MRRLISDAKYSVLINGERKGFFAATRGLKQGDPLSPSLFVLTSELLTKLLNSLLVKKGYTGFFMKKEGPQISHLAYADDYIIFTSMKKKSLNMMKRYLRRYEIVSGQKINTQKSNFVTHDKCRENTRRRIKRYTGYNHKPFPFTYLGCPIYAGRKKISLFSEITTKIMKKAGSWQGNLLSYGGRAIIIKQILQSQAMHLLAAMSPPKTVMNQIQRYLADFFWGKKEEKKKFHWSSWNNICYPKNEEGLGFTSIQDINKAFIMKRWWRLRTQDNLWSRFIRAKCCPRVNMVARKWNSGQSQSWKELMEIKKAAEPHMLWKINKGNSKLWWDNWTGVGTLALLVHSSMRLGDIQVKDFLINRQWDTQSLGEILPEQLVQHIRKIRVFDDKKQDQCYWQPSDKGVFTCSSAKDIIRQRNDINDTYSNLWQDKVPFKVSFLNWRILKKKIAVDDATVKFGRQRDPSCCCCPNAQHETIRHLFGESALATKLWEFFYRSMGIQQTSKDTKNILWSWWGQTDSNKLKTKVFSILPLFVNWQIWKARCAKKYGSNNISLKRAIHEVVMDVKINIVEPGNNIKLHMNWNEIGQTMDQYSHEIICTPVRWEKPEQHLIKLNTDGSVLQSKRKAGAGGIARDYIGEIIFAYRETLQFCTNNQVELQAAIIGISLCINQGISDIVLEMDSNLIVQMINEEAKPSWKLEADIHRLKELINAVNGKVVHCYREANFVADILAKEAAETGDNAICQSIQSLPRLAIGYFKMDRSNLHSFRVRASKKGIG